MPGVSAHVLQSEWNAALADAGLAGTDVVLWPCEGFSESGGDSSACAYPPDRDLDEADSFLPGLRSAGHDVDEEMRPRVALFTDAFERDRVDEALVPALLAGVLRHEMEHVKQFLYWIPRGVDLYELDGLVDRVLDAKAENKGSLYNAKPTENDANAAASRHLKQRYDRERHALHNDAQILQELARYPSGPEPVETLVPRLLGFCLLLRTPLEAYADRRVEPVARLIEYRGHAGTGQLWDDLATVIDSWAPNARA